MKSKILDEITSWIQRFRRRMMRLSYRIIHISGKNLTTADAPSRAPSLVLRKLIMESIYMALFHVLVLKAL